MDKEMKIVWASIAVGFIAVAMELAALTAVGYVAWHFIEKYW